VSSIPNLRDVRRPRGDYFLLWATPAGEQVPFAVSREVAVILEDRCPTSPYCPGERMPKIESDRTQGGPLWSYVEDETFRMEDGACPLGFASKAECYRSINVIAFKKGCIERPDLYKTASFFHALGYAVHVESFDGDDVDGNRILLAHGPIYNFHELRTELGPLGIRYYLVRNPFESDMPEDAVRLFPSD